MGQIEPQGGADDQALTLSAARRMLRSGELSALALVERSLQRIERVEPVLHACITVLGEQALEQARAADAQPPADASDDRPLRGIPLGLKDMICTHGIRTTAGSRVLADWVPTEDAEVVSRLLDAGAIPLAKTNTHEFAFGTVTPPTRNPWNPAHIPGGSSGGSAAAVAAGECLGAVGTDTSGSIRIPAAACGVTGLKPTFGLVGRTGVIPLSASFDTVGPIARSVEDCATLLSAIAGFDACDPDSVQQPLVDYAALLSSECSADDALRGLRIGVPTTYFFERAQPEIERAVRAAIAQLEALGASVVDVPVPASLEAMYDIHRTIQKAEAYTYHTQMGWLTAQSDLYQPLVRQMILDGADYTAREYILARQAQRELRDSLSRVLQRVRVLATPTLPAPARRVDEADAAPAPAGRGESQDESLRYTFPFNLSGHPALTVPCGFTSGGLPIGLQLVAAHLDERTLLRVGHAYQTVTDWHRRIPPVG